VVVRVLLIQESSTSYCVLCADQCGMGVSVSDGPRVVPLVCFVCNKNNNNHWRGETTSTLVCVRVMTHCLGYNAPPPHFVGIVCVFVLLVLPKERCVSCSSRPSCARA